MYDDRCVIYFQLVIPARKTDNKNEKHIQVDTVRAKSLTVDELNEESTTELTKQVVNLISVINAKSFKPKNICSKFSKLA